MVSQAAFTPTAHSGVFVVDVQAEGLARVPGIGAGSAPGLMAISPNRATLLAFDSSSGAVQIVDTTKETNTGSITLPGPNTQTAGTTISMVIPASGGPGYAADPVAGNNLWASPGGIIEMDLTTGAITTQIGVPNAQMVIGNATGTQLLVFSGDSDAVSVISPVNAVAPIDQGCNTAPNPVCTVVPGFDRPVFGVVSGNTAYILNCGAECGGKQASVSVFDLNTLTIAATTPVNGATIALLSGSALYVAGNGTATGTPCASIKNAGTTQATYCGTLDILDVSTTPPTDPYFNNPAGEVGIPDGYHDRIDLGLGGKLFIGSYDCTNIGNSNNNPLPPTPPPGEVRGCLAIFDTTKPGNATAFMPPINGDVTGLQGFSNFIFVPALNVTYAQEYVAENGTLWVYNTQTDQLVVDDILTLGTLPLAGDIIDVKAVDFF
jgi:hypothetical protein